MAIPPDENVIEAVNSKEKRSLYAARVAIHPKRVYGFFRSLKWYAMAILLGIYWICPWLRWDRGEFAPDQAILIDLPNRKAYFFAIEIWPQEVYYLTGLLIIAAIGLFWSSAILGRVWCGYACPQTVWTDLFITIERWVEGDRNARIKLDKAPWTFNKLKKRSLKHALWVLVSMATGGAFVMYFNDAPTLVSDWLHFEFTQAPALTVLFLTSTTYLLGGLAREHVCIYMCPYRSFQGAMFDQHSLIVTYDETRGEPRGAMKKKHIDSDGPPLGDCIDCMACVAVCPTGIDIRDGQQIACITCALCVDACDEMMVKVGKPKGLVRYDTEHNMHLLREGKKPEKWQLLRGRFWIYLFIMVAVGGFMLYHLSSRLPLDLNVIRDRNPLFVQLSDGEIRNTYTFKVINKTHDFQTYDITVSGLEGSSLMLLGEHTYHDTLAVTVKPDSVGTFRVFMKAPAENLESDDVKMTFKVKDQDSDVVQYNPTSFKGPKK